MARPDLHHVLRRSGVDRYVLAGEHGLLAQRQHWAAFAEPVASAAAGLIVAMALDYFIPSNLGFLTNLFWWAWFALVARAIWKWLEWRRDWLVATDQRLVLTYGMITQNVAMMPLAKVTDMSYKRSPLGRLLGYGTFVMESAGQDQALRRVDWVAHPDQTYRTICAEIFDVDDQERVLLEEERDHGFVDGPPLHAPELYAGKRDQAAADRVEADRVEADQPEDGEIQEIRVRYGERYEGDRSWWSHSPDLGEPAIREVDTGPVPYRRPATDEGGWSATTEDSERDRDRARKRARERDRDPHPDH